VNLLTPDDANCSFVAPEEASGSTYQYAVDSPNSTCYPNKVRKIRFNNLGSAMEIFLTSARDCSQESAGENDYWLLFKTTAQLTNHEEYWSFENLQNYKPGTTIFRGLKLIDKKEVASEIMRDATTCIKLSASGAIDTPVPGPALKLTSTLDTEASSEENGPDERKCPTDHFIIARYHDGDEQDPTHYTCGTVEGYHTRSAQWSPEFRESGLDKEETQVTANDKRYIYFTCPVNTAMTARWHSGNENGDTKYECSDLFSYDRRPVIVEPGRWSDELKESSKTYEVCDSNQVMIGRAHKNDENGETRYLCGTLRPLVAPGVK
jgi:hypothetical protein